MGQLWTSGERTSHMEVTLFLILEGACDGCRR